MNGGAEHVLSVVEEADGLDERVRARREQSEEREKTGIGGVSEGLSSLSSVPSLASQFPSALRPEAYVGLAGDVVHAIEPHTEADMAAVLSSVLAMFGNAVGRGPSFRAGDSEHATNLYVCVVGETGAGRKGTSAEGARRLIGAADDTWRKCIASGLVSGEGVIHHVRDPRSARRKPHKGEVGDADGLVEELVDAGSDDKRLLAYIPEFAQLLGAISRKDNTLSAVLRDLWDRGSAQTLAKNSPEQATNALVSLVAHVTPQELRDRLDSTEIANGFANRFIFVASRRSKLLPRGGSIPQAVIEDLAPRIAQALSVARLVTEIDMTTEAWELWDEHYETLTVRPPGLVGAVTGRAAPMVRRLAMGYALMDERPSVHLEHLRSALELWRYAEDSVKWVFGDRLGDRMADHCLALLRESGDAGLTRTELREALGHHVGAQRISDGLQSLSDAGLARCAKEATGGRPTERWYAVVER